MKEHTEDIIKEWKDFLVQLSENNFFNLIRLYLGEIKTPFNKQNLVESLSGFFRKEKIQKKIIAGLDSLDIILLSTVVFLPEPTENVLYSLFKNEYSYSELYDRIHNLEKRLIIFFSPVTKQLRINPYLSDLIIQNTSLNVFKLAESIVDKKNCNILIDNITLAGIYSFFLHNKDVIKLNGDIKKKVEDKFYESFPSFQKKKYALNYLLYSLLNLGLFTRIDSGFAVNEKKWEMFLSLTPYEIKMYLVIATSGAFKSKFLYSQSSILSSFLDSLNECAMYKKTDLERLLFIYMEREKVKFIKNDTVNKIEFAPLNINHIESFTLIDVAILFGLFYEKDGYAILNSSLKNDDHIEHQPILISPSFEVTLFPSNNLKNTLQVLASMIPVSIQTTGRFEITRLACGFCFAKNITAKFLCDTLKELSCGGLPQNVEVSIMQWYESFSSVQLYKGIIAIVAKDKQAMFEPPAPLSEIVLKKISDDVYILKGDEYNDVIPEIKYSGLEYLIRKKQVNSYFAGSLFNSIKKIEIGNTDFVTKQAWIDSQNENQKIYGKHIDLLLDKLKTLDLSKENFEYLRNAIYHRIIIYEDQISTATIKLPTIEVGGIDFLGKIRICEKAISDNHMLKIVLSNIDNAKPFLCKPVSIEKFESNALLKCCVGSNNELEKISIAHIAKIKIQQDSII